MVKVSSKVARPVVAISALLIAALIAAPSLGIARADSSGYGNSPAHDGLEGTLVIGSAAWVAWELLHSGETSTTASTGTTGNVAFLGTQAQDIAELQDQVASEQNPKKKAALQQQLQNKQSEIARAMQTAPQPAPIG